MSLKYYIFSAFFLFSALGGYAQTIDTAFIKSTAVKLSSDEMFGRGYTNNGMRLAGDYIALSMETLGLKVTRQSYSHSVNTFPDNISLSVNGRELVPGKDFLISAESNSATASGNLNAIDSVTSGDQANRVFFEKVKKLTWSVSQVQEKYTLIKLLNTEIGKPESYKLSVRSKFINKFNAQNIIGEIKGTTYPDSTVYFTAHYDHLGTMGNTVFNGANDNASGVAMMLGLAKYYAKNPAPYTIVFIAFGSEEAGLLGSKYYVDNASKKTLAHIKMLINLDLMGNGSEGITVVNATEFPKQFQLLQHLNKDNKYLPVINSRGTAANSDHYFFTQKGVPSFFIYTLGPRLAYHDIDDVADTLPWHMVNQIPQLLIQFVKALPSL
ncbi:M28 family metallopeptidase [Polluticaenibacter yanchengensis]|uniref:M28 family peptidase n=1 Tax=Polluticaenibacter yanchengensis TaxID=3014562 RepID=A0ABT4UJ50_9BACT|nr:M28 family peptidase [Chitinophagaceae bacterium LY-5]